MALALEPFRAVVLELGDGSWVHRAAAPPRPPLPGPRRPPPPAATDPRVEDRGQDPEPPGPVVPVVGVDAHLPHEQGLGVGAVLLPGHPARLVGPLPGDDIPVRPAPDHPGPDPLGLGASDEVDAAVA